MSIITSIKPQKNKKRVNIYLDDEFGFGIDLDNFVILGLKLNQELSDKQIEEIVKKAEFQKTFDKLLKWATGRPHSEKEIRDYLKRRKVPEIIYKDLFSRLKYFDLVGDEKFAKWFVESRNEFRPKPERILRQELNFKGISREIIDKILGETKIDEGKIAKDLLEKRMPHWERIEKEKLKQKQLVYLVQKGFSFELAKRAVSAYNIREDDEN